MNRQSYIRKLACRAAMVAGCALSLVACANPFAEGAPTLSEIFSAGWLFQDEETKAAAQAPLYCYGTIGKQDCYPEPLPREEGRLVGYQGPPPPTRDDL